MKFLQKYYSGPRYGSSIKPRYFLGDKSDPLFQRDYSTPVGEDRMDKSHLPMVCF